MPRIPLVAPEDLSPEMAEIYRSHPAGKLNIFRLHCHAPTCFPAYSDLAKAIFATLDVPPLERELVVLMVAVLQDCEYEWARTPRSRQPWASRRTRSMQCAQATGPVRSSTIVANWH